MLRQYPVTSNPEFHLIGKETERGWEQAEDISTLLPSLKHYEQNTGTANQLIRERLQRMSLNTLQNKTGLSRNTTRMVDAATLGRLTANSPQANRKRAHIARQNATAQHSWLASSQPRWLTDQLYSQKIQPLLANTSTSVIASSIGVSRCYAGAIRKGRFRPHPMHWVKLAKLVDVLSGG